jgi:hypothetical protein
MREDRLPEPSKELAARLLARVGFNDRFTATMVHPHTGPLPITAYSFQEVANLLHAPGLQIDLRTLAAWFDDAVGDEELASRTRVAIDEGALEKARSTVSALVQERLEQCSAMMEESTEDE